MSNIEHMVNRFLAWKLPADFSPDAGIGFKPYHPQQTPDNPMWPTGTNLLTAEQARGMFEYVLEGAQQPRQRPKLTPEDIAAEDAAGGVFAAGALVAQQPQYEAGDMASAHNDGFRAGVASVAQQPHEIEVQCPVCNHKFYEWPNDQQPQAEAAPEMHDAICPALTGGDCTCTPPAAIDKAWAQFCGGIGRGPDAPYPGMIEAFEAHYGQTFTDKDWREETGVWAAAWKAAKAHGEAAPQQAEAVPKDHPLYVFATEVIHGAYRYTELPAKAKAAIAAQGEKP